MSASMATKADPVFGTVYGVQNGDIFLHPSATRFSTPSENALINAAHAGADDHAGQFLVNLLVIRIELTRGRWNRGVIGNNGT